MPLRVTLGYPSAAAADLDADPEMQVGAGHWRGGFTPEMQAEWAAAFAPLALCKPYVQGAQWAHLSDAEPHQFPNCGLIDAAGQVKPAAAKLREIREVHLKSALARLHPPGFGRRSESAADRFSPSWELRSASSINYPPSCRTSWRRRKRCARRCFPKKKEGKGEQRISRDEGPTMQSYILMACVVFMIIGAVIAVVGRTMRRIERARFWSGENPPQWGGWVMLVGAAFFVPAAILLLVIVKYF